MTDKNKKTSGGKPSDPDMDAVVKVYIEEKALKELERVYSGRSNGCRDMRVTGLVDAYRALNMDFRSYKKSIFALTWRYWRSNCVNLYCTGGNVTDKCGHPSIAHAPEASEVDCALSICPVMSTVRMMSKPGPGEK